MKKIIEWENLTNFEIEELDKNIHLILPIGSVEAHGDHLSMNNDNIIAQFLARKLCLKTNSIYGFPMTIGNTKKLSDFPGSLNIREDILKEYLKDVINSYMKAGFKNIFIINAHKGNNNYIKEALGEIGMESIRFIFYKDIIENELDETYKGNHSNRLETEIAMLADSKKVKLDKARDNFVEDKNLIEKKFVKKYMPSCIDGYPQKANLESAKKILESIIKKIESILLNN